MEQSRVSVYPESLRETRSGVMDIFCFSCLCCLFLLLKVLGGFDLPCCACGYSPKTGLLMTQLCAFNLRSGTIFPDTSRRSLTFESRLRKYSQRGFILVFPSLLPNLPPDTKIQLGKDKPFYLDPSNPYGSRGKETPSRNFWFTRYYEPYAGSDYGNDSHPAIISYSNIIKASNSKNIEFVMLIAKSLEELLEDPKVPGLIGLDKLYEERIHRNHSKANIPVLTLYKHWYDSFSTNLFDLTSFFFFFFF